MQTGRLPVLVYIHGGCFDFGGTRNLPVDGIANNLARRGVVVVTIQYRLEIFGFFTTKTGEFPSNLGILDQIAALKWVQEEIGVFGGDPSQVTISGESSGGASVSVLAYSSHATRGLFSKVIMQSGTAYGDDVNQSGASKAAALKAPCGLSEEDWDAGDFSADFVHCFKSLSAEALQTLAASTGLAGCAWGPVSDASQHKGVLPDFPRNLAAQKTPDVPVLIGNCRDESFQIIRGDIGGNMSGVNAAVFERYVAENIKPVFPAFIWPQILAQIKLSAGFDRLSRTGTPAQWYMALVRAYDDYLFMAPTLAEVQNSWKSTQNIFLYSFDYVSDAYHWPELAKGVWHSMDLAFLFNQTTAQNYSSPIRSIWPFSASDLQVVDHFGRLWTNFVKTGDPNKPLTLATGVWEKVKNPSAPEFLSLGLAPSMGNGSFHPASQLLYRDLVPRLSGYRGPTAAPPASRAPPTRPPVTAQGPRADRWSLGPGEATLWLLLGLGALLLSVIALVIATVCALKARRST